MAENNEPTKEELQKEVKRLNSEIIRGNQVIGKLREEISRLVLDKAHLESDLDMYRSYVNQQQNEQEKGE